jgi:CheY-like chemotaxis protein
VAQLGGSMRKIFYLENDENDVLLLDLALRKTGRNDAIQWFRGSSQFKAALLNASFEQQPGAILIDLCLDGEYGLQVIAWLKDQPSLQYIPRFIFSSGRILEEITAVLEQQATGYMFKPSKFEGWLEIANQLKEMIQPLPLRPSELPVSAATVPARI